MPSLQPICNLGGIRKYHTCFRNGHPFFGHDPLYAARSPRSMRIRDQIGKAIEILDAAIGRSLLRNPRHHDRRLCEASLEDEDGKNHEETKDTKELIDNSSSCSSHLRGVKCPLGQVGVFRRYTCFVRVSARLYA